MKASNHCQTASIWILAALLLVLAPMGAQALDLDEVIRLKLAGVDEETIMQVADVQEAVFYLGVVDILDLRDAGCSNDFIRALMDTAQYAPDNKVNTGNVVVVEDYEPFDDDDYTSVFIHHYYDPFAYNWYAWPTSYVYYSPFWWSRCGFYHGGHWSRDWWDPFSPCVSYCDFHWGFERHFGSCASRIEARRRSDHRIRTGAATIRLAREKKLWQRAGLVEPATARTRVRSINSLKTDPSRLVSQSGRKYRQSTEKAGNSRTKSSAQLRSGDKSTNQRITGYNTKRIEQRKSSTQSTSSRKLNYRNKERSPQTSSQGSSSGSRIKSTRKPKTSTSETTNSTTRVKSQKSNSSSSTKTTPAPRTSSSGNNSSKSSSRNNSKSTPKNSRTRTR